MRRAPGGGEEGDLLRGEGTLQYQLQGSLFGEQKKNFKKAAKVEVKNNQAHIAKLNKKYIEDMEENDN